MKSAPVSMQERIAAIDIIRGFALLGIFLVNMPAFHSPLFIEANPEQTGINFWVDLFLQMFIQTKFYTIFSFLFGLGFYIFINRAEKRGLRTNRLFTKRLIALLIFGAMHLTLLWFGDILLTYAITGFVLMLFYKRNTKTLVIWAFSLLTFFHLLLTVQFFMPESEVLKASDEAKQEIASSLPKYVDVYEHASYSEWISYRIDTEVIPILQYLPITMITVLAMFLLGLYAGKIGIFHPDTPHLGLIKNIWRISLILSVPLVSFLAVLKLSILDVGVYQENAVYLFTSLSGLTLCFFYMSSLTLLLRKPVWQKRLRPLGYTGQMALTNYLSQTIICTVIFLGFDYYGKMSLALGTLMCLIIYSLQVLFSCLWLKRFKLGPMEWLWRSMTYGYFQSMKKDVMHVDTKNKHHSMVQ